jgi:hypothetical protein
MRQRAGTTQQVGFQHAFSPKAGRKQMATQYRPTSPEQIMQGAQTNLRDVQAPQNLTRTGDWRVSFDLTGDYYTHSIRQEDMHFFTVNHRGTLYRLAGLPMAWKCISYYFCLRTEVFIRQLREPLSNPIEHTPRLSTNQQPTRPMPS